jgi:hypothetical protein
MLHYLPPNSWTYLSSTEGTQKLCLPVAQHEQIGSELCRHCSMAWFGSSKGELGLLAAGLATL